MDDDKAIRAAKLTLGAVLDKRRARTAKDRADGQIAPSKYLPNVPRQVHADGGVADDDNQPINLGTAREQKQLQGFHQNLMNDINTRMSATQAAYQKAVYAGHFDGYDVGTVLQGKSSPLKITGHFMQRWKPNSVTLNHFDRLGAKPSIIEHEGQQYIPMLRYTSGSDAGEDNQEGTLYLDAVKATGYPKMGGLRAVKANGGSVDDEGIDAYHGSPHDFDAFDIGKIGTGEGNQSYGHGLYFAGNEGVAKGYKNTLSDTLLHPEDTPNLEKRAGQMALTFGDNTSEGAIRWLEKFKNGATHTSPAMTPELVQAVSKRFASGEFRPGGHMYKVKLNAGPHELLDWDARVADQHPNVLQKIAPFFPEGFPATNKKGEAVKGGDLYQMIVDRAGGVMHRGKLDAAGIPTGLAGGTPERVSRYLYAQGIKGLQYFDAGSRDRGHGTRNYVMFHHDPVKVLDKYALGGYVPQSIAKADGGSVADRSPMFEGMHEDLYDEDGKPTELWHGTPSQPFEAFDDSKIGVRDPGFFGRGHYLTPDRGVAEGYADPDEMGRGYVMGPMHAALKNPYVWDVSDDNKAHSTLRDLQSMGIMKGQDRMEPWDNLQRHHIDPFMAEMKRRGHDGVIYKTGQGVKEIVVFNPNMIKHRDAEVGDPNDPRIMRAKGGMVERALTITQRAR